MSGIRVNITSFCLQLFALILFPVAGVSQPSGELKKIFARAESYYLYEEYDLANELYILLDAPDNLNIKYKIGTCYLNIPGEKERSIPYLEAAVKDATNDSKTASFKEKRAPLDAYFSLAKAYMINNDLEKGLNTLLKFNSLAKATKGGMKNTDYIDQEIQACKNAIQFKSNPVGFRKEFLGNGFSQGAINDNPAVSFDGNTIIYTERRGIVNSIFCSKKRNGKWETPNEITSEINAGEDCSSCSLNSDGTELFLYKTENYDGSIYSTKYEAGVWSPIRKLNRNINTKFYESHGAISSDGSKLYFTSNREGGHGGLDIYVSEKDAGGDWGPAENLGPAVNSEFNEDTPFITRNDSVLYFCSEGHNSMGGYDNYKSFRTGTVWETPVNLGFPVNTPDNDKFFQPVNDGLNAYYSITTDYKKRDIFYLTFGSSSIRRLYEIKGKVSLNDSTRTVDNNYSIYLINRNSGDTLDIGFPNRKTGLYTFSVVPGKFTLVFTCTGYVSQSVDTAIQKDNPNLALNIDLSLRKDPDFKKVTSSGLVYEKINLDVIPFVTSVDTSRIIRDMNVNDLGDIDIIDSDVLYYTVQLMALYNPVDVSYFKYVDDVVVMYNDTDKFYRYTTGKFLSKKEAYLLRAELLEKGYPSDLFIKKVSKIKK
jgi:hypothetical protein